MEIKKYNDYIKETQPQDNVFRKFILAFVSGGTIGLLAQISKVLLMEYFMIEASLASSYVIACIIIITSILRNNFIYRSFKSSNIKLLKVVG